MNKELKLCLNVKVPTADDSYQNIGLKKNIDFYSEPYECDEIYSTDMLNYINADKLENYIEHLVSKLKRGGLLRLGGNDYIEISKMAIKQDFNVLEFNRIVFGDSLVRPIGSAITLTFITAILARLNVRVLMKRINGYEFFIEAERL